MCILSYIPKINGDFIITHSRDERIDRLSSKELLVETVHQVNVEFPMDMESKGTWILKSNDSNKNYITAILNGAFEKHERKLPYRKSRGCIPFDLLDYSHPDTYVSSYNLKNIEPFTQFILFNNQPYLLVWDGNTKHFNKLKKEFLVLSSSTLYNTFQKEKHANMISDSMITDKSAENLADIHYALKMELGDVQPKIKTTSITQIIKKNNRIVMNYKVLS